ncbi:MAG: hypothetical protein ABIG71_01390 [Candidatus Uhrbacteria bacterium]
MAIRFTRNGIAALGCASLAMTDWDVDGIAVSFAGALDELGSIAMTEDIAQVESRFNEL